jgi:hypothetical protein
MKKMISLLLIGLIFNSCAQDLQVVDRACTSEACEQELDQDQDRSRYDLGDGDYTNGNQIPYIQGKIVGGPYDGLPVFETLPQYNAIAMNTFLPTNNFLPGGLGQTPGAALPGGGSGLPDLGSIVGGIGGGGGGFQLPGTGGMQIPGGTSGFGGLLGGLFGGGGGLGGITGGLPNIGGGGLPGFGGIPGGNNLGNVGSGFEQQVPAEIPNFSTGFPSLPGQVRLGQVNDTTTGIQSLIPINSLGGGSSALRRYPAPEFGLFQDIGMDSFVGDKTAITDQSNLTMGVDQDVLMMFYDSPYDPYLEQTYPIRNSETHELMGYYSTLPATVNGQGGAMTFISLPDSVLDQLNL